MINKAKKEINKQMKPSEHKPNLILIENKKKRKVKIALPVF